MAGQLFAKGAVDWGAASECHSSSNRLGLSATLKDHSSAHAANYLIGVDFYFEVASAGSGTADAASTILSTKRLMASCSCSKKDASGASWWRSMIF